MFPRNFWSKLRPDFCKNKMGFDQKTQNESNKTNEKNIRRRQGPVQILPNKRMRQRKYGGWYSVFSVSHWTACAHMSLGHATPMSQREHRGLASLDDK